MITNVSPTKVYNINDRYNLVVIEDSDGDLHNLVFSNSEILKARSRGINNSHKMPQYTLRLCCGTSNYVMSIFLAVAVGMLAGYFTW